MRHAGKRKRIMIVGQPGSGKSTLARQLGAALGLPVFHIDCIHWQPGWIERSGPEKDRLCAEVHAKDEWIFEGGRSQNWPERLVRADTLIFLDFPLLIRAWRVLMRRIEYRGVTRPDLPVNCPENINWEFTQYIWQTRHSNRLRMIELFNTAPETKDKYRLRNRHDVAHFVHQMEAENSSALTAAV